MTELARVLEEFQELTKTHELNIFSDSPKAKVLTFRPAEGTTFWYDIVSWCGRFCISGDFGTYVFGGNTDMLGFFRGGDISPSYWSQRLRATDTRSGHEQFSKQLLEGHLLEQFETWAFSSEEEKNREWDRVNDNILGFAEEGEFSKAYEEAVEYRSWEASHAFEDLWDYNYKKHTYRYLWCCCAIQKGIKMYDEFKLNEQRKRNR